MSLIVEDGTGLANAESLCSVADADTIHAARGNAAWALLTTPQKEQNLRKGTDYMTGKYTTLWAGYRKTAGQALDWPREDVPIAGLRFLQYYDNGIVPNEVKQACALLALRASTGDDLMSDERQKVISESVEGAVSVTYSEFSSVQVRYTEIDAMLSRFLANGAGRTAQMVRI